VPGETSHIPVLRKHAHVRPIVGVTRSSNVSSRSVPDYAALRRAGALSLRHYDHIRDDLAAALRRHLKRYPEDRDLVAYAEGVDLPDSALITLHRSDLWEITELCSSCT
jgi:hypothetical protein